MNLRTLLGWSLAATLLAACSGGGGGVSPSNGASSNTPAQITTGTQFAFSLPYDPSGDNAMSVGRSPKFIGTAATVVSYTFNPGNITGSFGPFNAVTHTFPGCTSNYPVTPYVYTCDVALAPGPYNVTLTLAAGATTIGSSNATVVPGGVVSGATAPVNVTVNPINAGPALALSGVPTQFYVDTMAGQTVSLQANELDPAGDIITTFYGPVVAGFYKALTFAASGGAVGITTPPANILVNTPPAGQTGYVGNPQYVIYNGVGVNASSYGLTLTDGTNTTPVVNIPYVSMSNNVAGSLTFAGIGAPYNQLVTVTESTTAASGGLDAHFNSTTTCAGPNATFAPTLGVGAGNWNATTIAGPSATVTYTITPLTINQATCTMTVTSVEDPNMSQVITLNFPGQAGVGVNSHTRQ